jgi:sulfoxide reductase heme-binding subunit YedZ
MSHAYKAVGWNRQKRIYDLLVVSGVLTYLALFALANALLRPEITAETLLIRAFGSCALVLLHIILSIGPLCRLDDRFLPLLYNRRHLGVTMFLTALVHGVISIIQFHLLGPTNPLVSVLTSNGRFGSLANFPFQPLGLAALVILFLMAATSHDFWLANLTPPTWKALHMSVYLAYGLVVAHVALGTMQAEGSVVLALLLAAGLIWVLGLHLLAAKRERRADQEQEREGADDGFVEVCRVGEIPELRAKVVTLSGERVAIFRYGGKISALSNVCQHQNGPLGEGQIIDGCVTCPWHGFQYSPDAGASPPPFEEKVPTFRVRVEGDRVFVHPQPNAPGTRVEPASCMETQSRSAQAFYVGYQAIALPAIAARIRTAAPWAFGVLGLLGILVASLQGPYDRSVFEYQNYRTYEGTIVAQPHPMLAVDRPGLTEQGDEASLFALTVFGKRGADAAVEGFDGQRVQLSGALIFHQGQTMLEIQEGSIRALGGAGTAPDEITLGGVTLVGEIVDSKCYLGTMKPGRFKAHRACASNCIAGGVAPLLLVDAADGSRSHYWLVDLEGRPINRQVLEYLAEPVRIRGEERQRGDLRILAADPGDIERLQ